MYVYMLEFSFSYAEAWRDIVVQALTVFGGSDL